MATPNQIVVDSFNNNVDIQTNDNQLHIISEVCNTEVTVTQPVTTVVQVSTVGLSGSNGTSGLSGSSGTSGSSGSSGINGTSGSSGDSGTSGSSGDSGTSGSSGDSGTSGTSGSSGSSGVSPVNAFVQDGNSFGATAVLGTNDTQDLQFETSGSIRMTISSSGNVGIGTTSPTSRLQVRGSGATSATTALRVENSNASASLVVLDNGNVGIGTTSPTVRLHLSQSSGIFQRVDINNANADGVNATQQYYTNTGATPDLFGATSFRLQGGTTDAFKQFQVYIANLTSPRFIINGSGNVGINTTSPNARLHISGANSDVLLIASSSAAPSALFVSGSGNVGIGTLTPTNTLNVNGTTFLQGGQTTVRGSGATSATTALRVENSNASASLVVRNDGNVGIGTSTPTNTLQVVGGVTATSFTGSLFGTSSWAQNALTASNITPAVTNNTDNYLLTATGGGTINGESKLRYDGLELFVSSSDILLSNNKPIKYYVNEEAGQINILNSNYSYLPGVPNNFTAGTSSLLGISPTKIEIRSAFEDAVGGWVSGSIHFITPTGSTVITNEGRLGLGTGLPSASFHISGASNSNLLRVSSPTQTNILFVSGSGRVGIGTETPTNTLQVAGGVTATSFTGSLQGIATTESKVIAFSVGSIFTPITTGSKNQTIYYSEYSGSITGFRLSANTSSTAILDIWKDNNTIPTNANSIVGSNKPQLITNQLTSSTNVSDWTTSFAPNDVFIIEVESNDNATFMNLQLITEQYI